MDANCAASAADWAAAAAAVATVIVALVVAWVSWRQYTVSRDQMRLALFDRRLEVYDKVYKFLSDIQGDRRITNERLVGFIDAQHKSNFFFRSDVTGYLAEIRNHALTKQSHDTMADDSIDDQEARLKFR